MSNGSEEVCLHTLLDNLCPFSLSFCYRQISMDYLFFFLLCIASWLMECINHAYITQKVQKKDDWSLDFGGGWWMLRLNVDDDHYRPNFKLKVCSKCIQNRSFCPFSAAAAAATKSSKWLKWFFSAE